MKLNVFKIGPDGTHRVSRDSDAYGNEAPQVIDVEDDLIEELELDALKLTADQILARKFLKFLGERRIKIGELKSRPEEEQRRLRREFLITV